MTRKTTTQRRPASSTQPEQPTNLPTSYTTSWDLTPIDQTRRDKQEYERAERDAIGHKTITVWVARKRRRTAIEA